MILSELKEYGAITAIKDRGNSAKKVPDVTSTRGTPTAGPLQNHQTYGRHDLVYDEKPVTSSEYGAACDDRCRADGERAPPRAQPCP